MYGRDEKGHGPHSWWFYNMWVMTLYTCWTEPSLTIYLFCRMRLTLDEAKLIINQCLNFHRSPLPLLPSSMLSTPITILGQWLICLAKISNKIEFTTKTNIENGGRRFVSQFLWGAAGIFVQQKNDKIQFFKLLLKERRTLLAGHFN